MRKVTRAHMSIEEWEALVEATKRWCYEVLRSDVETDHPEGVWALDEPFNELCAHVEVVGGKRREEDVENSAEELHARSYQTASDVEIVWREDGAWAIADDYGYVLNRSGVWEWEWNPGSRDAAFIERTRYETPREALKHWKACSEIQKEEGNANS